MSRFNNPTAGTKTTNLAGGQAYSQTSELEFVSILLTSFVQDQFYRSASDGIDKVRNLISQLDPVFVAKAAIYARDKFGMRSISHVVASELAKKASGTKWGTNFYDKVIIRPDDVTEILSYHLITKKEKLPNAMRKGLGKALGRFDSYSLAKYKGEGKEVSLVDAVNILHPKRTEKAGSAIGSLVKGELKSVDTWESSLSAAGQVAESEEDLTALKAEAWKTLITEKKIKYFALLRNLRNIVQQSPDALDAALTMLIDESQISKSRIFPFRYMTAYDEIKKLTADSTQRKVLIALSKAMDISVKNVPVFDGDTCIVVDSSGSMTYTKVSDKSNRMVSDLAAVFAAVLAKANNADLVNFADHASYNSYNPLDSTTSIIESFNFASGGTNFRAIFNVLNKRYKRVIILSDMQGWVGHNTPHAELSAYKTRYNADPYIYSFDLAGYGTLQFPERNVFCLAGFSDKTLEVMKLLEQDRRALINEINKMVL